MSGLMEDSNEEFTMRSNCLRTGIKINEVYVNISKVDGKLIVSTHPIGTGIIDNYIKRIETPLFKKDIVNNYPTLKKQQP